MKVKTALTVAEINCNGGAGNIQADIKTMTMNGIIYSMHAITALTALSKAGVSNISDIISDFPADQTDLTTCKYPKEAL